MNTNQKISWIYLTSRVRQLMVAALSVIFGISMYVFMNGFMSGVNNAQTEITFTSMAHIKIYNELSNEVSPIVSEPEGSNTLVMLSNARTIRYTEGIRNTAPIKEAALGFDEVTGVTEQLNQNVFIRNGVTKVSANLSGIDITGEDQLFKTSEYMQEGSLYELEKQPNAIILGSKLAQNLGVAMNDNISLLTSDGVSKTFKIAGIFETGSAATDKSKAMVSIRTARQLFSKNRSYATEILINVKDYNRVDAISSELASTTNYKVESWKEGNDQLNSANVLREILAIAVSLTILIVAGFGIYNIMSMTVNEKVKEIAILKAMGFNGRDIVQIFLVQSVIIGLIGGFIGLIFGNIISRIIDHIPFKIASLTTLPMDFSTSDYVMAFLFGIVTTIIAGYLPARKASKVDPVAILRG